MLSPAYIGIEDLMQMPFLSLYLQLDPTNERVDVPLNFDKIRQIVSCKHKIEEVLKDYKTDANETRKKFFKKIRIDDKKKVSNPEITAFREHFQISLGLSGLSSNAYNCLGQFTTSSSADPTNSLKHLLSVWVDPA
ncbi:3248_t:CDS:1, partial [Ambispora leptoticha]